ncbi:MAG: hypothetical protein COB15_13265 [Flavobacteriales bacterium]|nr:MAG: hypothetical protein COB15_13265 [Flavobacteriales bacterium]
MKISFKVFNLSNLKIAKQLPFKILIKRILKRIFPSKKIDYTLEDIRRSASNYTVNSLLNITDFKISSNPEIISCYLKHEFDLLGSGWVSRNSTRELNLADEHQFFSENLSQNIGGGYQLINWQLDVASGFSFRANKQFDDQIIDKSKNVDIKNCWELGRLQHLPQMAIAAITAENKEELIIEFKNQSIDFIVSNPIGMGVQWACAMDVGIRLANWLVAYDIFKQVDSTNILNDKFTLILTDAIYQHALFIYNHLEHKEGAAGNHYLFNLVGLLFATNYLSIKDETLEWRAFAEEEIEKEFEKQFFSDGGNFEGSTTYHCLSAEAMLYATALMLRNGKKLSKNYIDLLGKSAQFIKDVIKPNGEMPQFGDNDSGRLFKFLPESSLLNYESLLAGFSGLFGGKETTFVEQKIIEQISKNTKIVAPISLEKKKHQIRNAKHQLQKPTTTEIKFANDINTDEIKLYAYDEFGIYVFKSAQFYLAISTISNKKMHHSWGHVHNDKLSFDLQVNGIDMVKDPGTYTYSAFPDKRNEYRSSKAHHGIVVKGIDQNKEFGLVYLEREITCKVLEIKGLTITLQANYYGVEHTRKFTILDNQLIVTDYCNKPYKVNINKFEEYSPIYGVSQKRD